MATVACIWYQPVHKYPGLILKEPMKAFYQEHDPPFLGDIRPTIDLPAGFDLNELTDFEVWDGTAWVKPNHSYRIQEK
jgi:hypothetical protein